MNHPQQHQTISNTSLNAQGSSQYGNYGAHEQTYLLYNKTDKH